MGLLDKFFQRKQNPPEQYSMEEEQFMRDQFMNQPLGGQPIQQQPITVIPPSLEKETMELYLKPRIPEEVRDPSKLIGADKYWVFTTEAVTTVLTSNMNAHRQKRILRQMRIAQDFDGVDDVENIVNDKMIGIFAEITTDKARSDFSDGVRERIAPSVGVGMSGAFNAQSKETGERPKENRAIFGLFGNKKQ